PEFARRIGNGRVPIGICRGLGCQFCRASTLVSTTESIGDDPGCALLDTFQWPGRFTADQPVCIGFTHRTGVGGGTELESGSHGHGDGYLPFVASARVSCASGVVRGCSRCACRNSLFSL